MTKVTVNYKPKNGKLLRITLDFDNGIIKEVKIFGDYFLYPEEAIFEIEKALVGVKIKRETILEAVKTKFKELNVLPIGISAEAICDGILLAYNKKESQ